MSDFEKEPISKKMIDTKYYESTLAEFDISKNEEKLQKISTIRLIKNIILAFASSTLFYKGFQINSIFQEISIFSLIDIIYCLLLIIVFNSLIIHSTGFLNPEPVLNNNKLSKSVKNVIVKNSFHFAFTRTFIFYGNYKKEIVSNVLKLIYAVSLINIGFISGYLLVSCIIIFNSIRPKIKSKLVFLEQDRKRCQKKT